MIDRWLERMTRPSPHDQASAQMQDLRANTKHTLTQLATRRDADQTRHILHKHMPREADILERGKPAVPERCGVCGRYHPGPPGNLWTNNPGIKLIWAVFVAVLVFLLSLFIGWWALTVFPVAWLVSQSFLWSLPLPAGLAFLLLLVQALGNTSK
jgi:hypothetical protein